MRSEKALPAVVQSSDIGRDRQTGQIVSASHFSRVIRHRTGRTPLQLRRAVYADILGREAPDLNLAC